jgi:23S rRNA-/tRNA-specific pseudouridylate synthase
MRISAHIAAKYNLSRRYVKAAIQAGRVSAEGRTIRSDGEADTGLNYEISLVTTELDYKIEDYLVKEAGDVVFLYKPPLMHSERHRPEDALCLDDVLSGSFPEHRLVSRLDYGVDGIVPALKKGVEISSQHKVYLAWVENGFPEKAKDRWDVDADGRKRVKAYPSEDGILMSFERLRQTETADLIKISLELAHRHQVRAVCAAMGHPIIGDGLYGKGEENGRILLHCAEAEINGEIYEIYNHYSFYSLFLYSIWKG